MKKRMFRILVSISVLIFFVISCSKQVKKDELEINQERKLIKLWTVAMKPSFEKYIDNIIDTYERDNKDISVEWTDFSKEQIVGEIGLAFEKASLPDVLCLDGVMILNELNSDMFMNLSSENNYMYDTFFKGLVDSFKKEDSKIIAMPWYADIQVLFLNKILFEQAGLTENNYPKTDEEFISLLGIIKEKTGKYGSVLDIDNIQNLISMGLSIFGEDNKLNINTEEVSGYLKTRQSLYNNEFVPKELINFADKLSLYSNSEVGMIKSKFQSIETIKIMNEEVCNNTVILPLPLNNKNERYADVYTISIISNDERREEALRFAKFLTNEQNQLELAKQFNVLPTNKNLFNKGIFKASEDNSMLNKSKSIAYESLKNSSEFFYKISNYNEVFRIIDKHFATIYLDGYVVEDILKETQREIDMLYNR